MDNKDDRRWAVKEVFTILFCLTCIILIILCCFYIFDPSFRSRVKNEPSIDTSSSNNSVDLIGSSTDSSQNEPIGTVDIHVIDLEDGHYGQSIYVKAGNFDILIDAGNSISSFSKIKNVIDSQCTDNCLEYVIASSCTEERIGAFYSSTQDSIFTSYKIGTLIDFGTMTGNTNGRVYYANYLAGKEYLKNKGATISPASNSMSSFDLGNSTSLEILPNQFYGDTTSSGDHSVIAMIRQSTNHYMFMSDATSTEQQYLLDNYSLSKADLLIAPNYGSAASVNKDFLASVNPTVCIVSCCAGEVSSDTRPFYRFPSNIFTKAIGKYTSKVYVPSYTKDDGNYAKLNGNITASYSSTLSLQLSFETANTLLKDSDWFISTTRDWPN